MGMSIAFGAAFYPQNAKTDTIHAAGTSDDSSCGNSGDGNAENIISDSPSIPITPGVPDTGCTTTNNLSVVTSDPLNVTNSSASLVMNNYSGFDNVTINQIGVEYGLSPDLIDGVNAPATDITTPYNVDLSNLQSGTTYYYRAYVITPDGTNYGEIKQFQTLNSIDLIGTITWNEASNAHLRPCTVTIELLQNGTVIDSIAVASGADYYMYNGYNTRVCPTSNTYNTFSFTNLPSMDSSGTPYTYTVTENSIPFYGSGGSPNTIDYTTDAMNNIVVVITNWLDDLGI